MTRLQYAVIFLVLGLFCLLYFGFSTQKPANSIAIGQTKSPVESEIQPFIEEAKKAIPGDSLSWLTSIENSAKVVGEAKEKAEMYKKISGWWYRQKRPDLAGYYAEKVAEIENTDAAWAIAATSYTSDGSALGAESKAFCEKKSIAAFEKAIQLAPDNTAHQVNLALCYVNHPPSDMPMKGIQMLLEINKKEPENVMVLLTLSRLAIRTGQYDKAISRLEKVISIEPENTQAACLLADAYQQVGNPEKSESWMKKCK